MHEVLRRDDGSVMMGACMLHAPSMQVALLLHVAGVSRMFQLEKNLLLTQQPNLRKQKMFMELTIFFMSVMLLWIPILLTREKKDLLTRLEG